MQKIAAFPLVDVPPAELVEETIDFFAIPLYIVSPASVVDKELRQKLADHYMRLGVAFATDYYRTMGVVK